MKQLVYKTEWANRTKNVCGSPSVSVQRELHDDRHHSYYAYDHTGERAVKLTGDNGDIDANADIMSTYAMLRNLTLYPSPYMVVSDKGYTNVTEVESRENLFALPRCSNVTERKHYYAGADRVAAVLGGRGKIAVGKHPDLGEHASKLFEQSLWQISERWLSPNDEKCIAKSADTLSPDMKPHIGGIPGLLSANAKVVL